MSAAGLNAKPVRLGFFRLAAAVEGDMRLSPAPAVVGEGERPRADGALQG